MFTTQQIQNETAWEHRFEGRQKEIKRQRQKVRMENVTNEQRKR
jgi:hypothetical protein